MDYVASFLSLSLFRPCHQPCVSISLCVAFRAHTQLLIAHAASALRETYAVTYAVALFFILHFSFFHARACTTRFLNVLLIRDVLRIKKESPSLPFSPSAISSVRLPLGVRVSFNRARRRSLSPALALLLSRTYPFPVSSVFLLAPTRAFPLPLPLANFFLPPRLRFLPPAVRGRSRITATIAGFSYIFVRPRGVPARRDARGGSAAPSPRRSRTVVT